MSLKSRVVSVLVLALVASAPSSAPKRNSAVRRRPPVRASRRSWSAAAAVTTTPTQDKILMETVRKILPVDWMVAYQGGTGTNAMIPLYSDPNWFKATTSSCTTSVMPTSATKPSSGPSRQRIRRAFRRWCCIARCTRTVSEGRRLARAAWRDNAPPHESPPNRRQDGGEGRPDHHRAEGRLGDADRRAVRDRQGVAEGEDPGHRREPRGRETPSTRRLDERLRRRAASSARRSATARHGTIQCFRNCCSAASSGR